MSENEIKINRPKGAKETDYNDLNDWTVTDIATAPGTSPEDRANAEAEIARREQAGTYDPDSAPHAVRSDMLSHGYGVEGGKVLYPTDEYRTWLDSDRTTPPPQTVLKETIAERRTAESRAKIEKYERQQNRKRGQDAIHSFIDDFLDNMSPNSNSRSKINHSHDNPSAKELRDRERSNPNLEYQKAHRAVRNEKVYDYRRSQSPESIVQNEEVKAEGPRILSPSERFERATDKIERLFKKPNATQDYYTEGAIEHISEGDFTLNPAFVLDGFKAVEGITIDRIAGPARDEVWGSIKYGDIDVIPKIDSPEQLTSLEREAIRTAMEIGAYRESAGITGNGAIKYALPIGKIESNKLSEILAKYDLGYKATIIEDGDTEEDIERKNQEIESHNKAIYESLESGFVGIIDLLKSGEKSNDDDEFEAANWYFDGLLSAHAPSEIIESVMNGYIASESEEFVKKFDEFLKTRSEVVVETDFKRQNEGDRNIVEFTKEHISSNGNAMIFPEFDPRPSLDQPNKTKGSNRIRPGFGKRKYNCFVDYLMTLQGRTDFEAEEQWVAISKPFYIRKSNKTVHEVVFDEKAQCYRNKENGREISSDSVRQYMTAKFKLEGVDMFVAESITDATEAFYLSHGEAAVNHEATYGGTKKEAQGEDQNGVPMAIKFNHSSFTANGIRGYHRFETMYGRINRTVDRIIASAKETA